MIHIWVKLLDDDHRIVSQAVAEQKKLPPSDYLSVITKLCNELDISTPIFLNKHMQQFMSYRCATFLPADFVEKVAFCKMVVEIY